MRWVEEDDELFIEKEELVKVNYEQLYAKPQGFSFKKKSNSFVIQ